MTRIDKSKLISAESVLASKYGERGSDERTSFDAKAKAYYYGVILRDRRKELKMTQVELAEKAGTARSYIAHVERGETDIQVSSLMRIANALQMSFVPQFA